MTTYKPEVGDSVEARAIVGVGRTVVGGITHITGSSAANRLCTVATDDGVIHVPPADVKPSDEPAWLVRTDALKHGQVVVLFNGLRRVIDCVRPIGNGVLRVDYEVPGNPWFKGNTAIADSLWRLLSTAEENQ